MTSKANQLKKNIKLWEKHFKHIHCRKPSKADIDRSPSEIRDAYKEYWKLKVSLCSKKENESEEVFGEYLNKSKLNNTSNLKRNNVKHKRKGRKWIKGTGYVTVDHHVDKEIDIRSLEKDVPIKDISVPAHLPTRCVDENGRIVTNFTHLNIKHGFNISDTWLNNVKTTCTITESRLSTESSSQQLELSRSTSWGKCTDSFSSLDNWNSKSLTSDALPHETRDPSPLPHETRDPSPLPHETRDPSPLPHETGDSAQKSSNDKMVTLHHIDSEDDKINQLSTSVLKEISDNKSQCKSISNNFVRLNMKKKYYCRKYTRINGSHYKRQQWKKKKQKEVKKNESKTNACFVCGKFGHWASNCTEQYVLKENELLDQCPYPSVEEMADCDMDSTCKLHQVGSITVGDKQSLSVHPLLTTCDSSVIDDEIEGVLKIFGYSNFKSWQKKAILSILSGISTLLVQPTGSGKSLCYQIPAYLYCKHSLCFALVISPLISLMEDQVENLPVGLSGACLHTGILNKQKKKIINDISAGLINILFISPEMLVNIFSRNEETVHWMSQQLPPISFACIDEVHCISDWSHNFRPTYFRVQKILKKQLGVRCTLGLTATASRSAIDNIAQMLDITPENVLVGSIVPENLSLSVSCEKNREQALIDLLRSQPYNNCESIIIYCTRQQTTERIAQLLRTSLQLMDNTHVRLSNSDHKRILWDIDCYHAGLSTAHRKHVQSDFMSGKLRIIVATIAFGMGLNKPDVRAIIHYNMPQSFESFVQEIGRAGRDGNPAYCHVFISDDKSDLFELQRHVYSSSMDYWNVKKLIQHIFQPIGVSQVQGLTALRHEVAVPIDLLVQDLDLKEEAISTLLYYLEFQGHVEVLNVINDVVTMKCYGGSNHLQHLASRIVAINEAFKIEKDKGTVTDKSRFIKFSLTQVANALNCPSSTIHETLYHIQCSSNVIMEFSSLSFHLLLYQDISNDEKDLICQYLLKKVKDREERDINKLHQLLSILKYVSAISNKLPLSHFMELYFNDKLNVDYLESLGVHCHSRDCCLSESRIQLIQSDMMSLVSIYGDDHQFTGRAIARILHGISSPCYPAEIWGKCQFWRKQLDVDFNTLVSIATKQLISFLN